MFPGERKVKYNSDGKIIITPSGKASAGKENLCEYRKKYFRKEGEGERVFVCEIEAEPSSTLKMCLFHDKKFVTSEPDRLLRRFKKYITDVRNARNRDLLCV